MSFLSFLFFYFSCCERCVFLLIRRRSICSERKSSQLQLLSDLCDLTIPTSALGWTSLDDGLVGLAGTVSSLIGVYTQWKKTA